MSKWLVSFTDMLKIFTLFMVCTLIFYFGLQMIHKEYEQLHRYDQPQGKAVKVFQPDESSWLDRLSIFFRLGE